MADNNLIDELDEIIAITDPETYELLYSNKRAMEEFGFHSLKGKKCYEVFCGRRQPCEFCSDIWKNVEKEKFTVWKPENGELDKHYFVQVKWVTWNNRMARMMVAKQIPEMENEMEDVPLAVSAQEKESFKKMYQGFRFSLDITKCMNLFLSKTEFKAALKSVLEYIGKHYQASHCILWEWTIGQELLLSGIWDSQEKDTTGFGESGFYNRENQEHKSILENKSIHLNSNAWRELFLSRNLSVVQDISMIKEHCKDDYSTLLSLGIKNILLAPLWGNGELIGFVWVGNPRGNRQDEAFLQNISVCVSLHLNARNNARISFFEKYYDLRYHYRNRLYFQKQVENGYWNLQKQVGMIGLHILELQRIYQKRGTKTGEMIVRSIADSLFELFGMDNVYYMGSSRFMVVVANISRSAFMKRVEKFSRRYNYMDCTNIAIGCYWCDVNSDIMEMIARVEDQISKIEENQKENNFFDLENMISGQTVSNQEVETIYKEIDDSLNKERRQKEKSLKFETMLQHTYEEIYDINMTKDAVSLIFKKEELDREFPSDMTVRQFLRFGCREWVHPLDTKRLLQYCKDSIELRNPEAFEFRCSKRKDNYFWAYMRFIPIKYPWDSVDSDVKYLLCVSNIDKFVRDRETAKTGVNKYAMVAGEVCDFICDIDISTKTYTILHSIYQEEVFPAFGGDYDTMILSVSENEIHSEDRRGWLDTMLLDNMLQILRTGEKTIHCSFRKKNGEGSYEWKNSTVLYQEEQGDIKESIIVMTYSQGDKEQHPRKEQFYLPVEQEAKESLDSLTGLLNQDGFYSVGQKMLNKKPYQDYCVVIMDIDKFKLINNLYGMGKGNRALMQIAQVIEDTLSKEDISGRMYADVFYMMMEFESEEKVILLLQQMIDKLKYSDFGSMILPCFGIGKGRGADNSVASLCDMAGFAHKFSKTTPGSRWKFYDSGFREKVLEEKEMESEMETALHNGEFQVYLQPKYRIKTSQVVGAEALVRWIHPKKGILMPKQFIPLFEKNGFILKLDTYIWEQVCKVLKRWHDTGKRQIPISVNMSKLHLREMKFQKTVKELAQRYHINPKWMELELTEGLLFENIQLVSNVLSGLQKDGFAINLDDFDGYSSLNMLRDIPIDILKIDGHFFDEAMITQRGKTMMKYVVAMAKELNMRIIAEGVENAAQEKFLEEIGCKVAQGFYFSQPVSVVEFESRYYD